MYHEVRAVGERVRQKYVPHPPWVIAAVLLWAALHDRPVSWACDPRHWDIGFIVEKAQQRSGPSALHIWESLPAPAVCRSAGFGLRCAATRPRA